ncbi:plasmid replication protein RepC [Mariluticola halotolerans]|uniref:plasmid replication protein RepC n=1 Tax=Mariluticola halotolerans TaxID=2909283 RepID=UPI0026E3F715|nr:plasmid replication protein RepC [Mariluticola halotolerans]UJQ96123.1 replication protein C domain-containing protein [Mariluticola halotolerans]
MTEPGLTPFGSRRLDAAILAGNMLADTCPGTLKADKWEVLRHCITAKSALGVSDRALTVLSALLSCHKETELRGDESLVVFPSNRELARRAHGISEPTLRRALAQLVAARLLVRRDSPNGKRYARRGQGGAITRVFGFDLKPLLARAADIALMAEDVEAERREMVDLRERITLLRRDIAKGFMLAEEIEHQNAIAALREAYLGLKGGNMRQFSADDLGALAFDLEQLLGQLTKILNNKLISSNMNANDRHIERHKQDSNQTLISDSEGSRKTELEGKSSVQPLTPDWAEPEAAEGGKPEPHPENASALPLGNILEACPSIRDYGRHGVGNWSELVAAARLARAALGISPSAWDDAAGAMGQGGAAVTVATILERHAEIASPGGYLRALTDKAAHGKFTPAPVIQALLRRRLKEMEHA